MLKASESLGCYKSEEYRVLMKSTKPMLEMGRVEFYGGRVIGIIKLGKEWV